MLHAQAPAHGQRVDVGFDARALVHEFGVGGDQADEFAARHFPLVGRALRIFGDQLHDVVVIDHLRGEEDQFKIRVRAAGGAFSPSCSRNVLNRRAVSRYIPLETLQPLFRHQFIDPLLLLRVQVGVLIQLGYQAPHVLEQADEPAAGLVPLQVRHVLRPVFPPPRSHEIAQPPYRAVEFIDDFRSGSTSQISPASAPALAGEQRDRLIDLIALVAEIEDIAEWLGLVQHPVGSRKRLYQPVISQGFVHVQRVEEFGVEAGEQHVHHDHHVDFVRARQVAIGILLVLDALLHILIVTVEFVDGVVGAISLVVIGDDGVQRFLLFFGFDGVVDLLLRQVLLDLPHVLVALGGRGEDAGDVQRLEVRVFRPAVRFGWS